MSSLFFKPIHLYFQTANLAIELILFLFGVFRLLLTPFAEDITGLLKQQLFSGVDLSRVNIELCCNLVDCLVTFQCFDRYLGFEF